MTEEVMQQEESEPEIEGTPLMIPMDGVVGLPETIADINERLEEQERWINTLDMELGWDSNHIDRLTRHLYLLWVLLFPLVLAIIMMIVVVKVW